MCDMVNAFFYHAQHDEGMSKSRAKENSRIVIFGGVVVNWNVNRKLPADN